MAKNRVRTLIVDDSAVVRQILTQELSKDPAIEVVGSAGDPYVARDKILREKPDVITLDLEMPRMDGLSFLKRLMFYHPMPVVILSSLATEGASVALEALEWGAVDVIAKPRVDFQRWLLETMPQLIDAVKAAAHAKVSRPAALRPPSPASSKARASGLSETTDKIVAIGASTGGTEAIKEVLMALPPDCPGILIAIHMPADFTQRYASRLNDLCAIEVREAVDGDRLHSGLALVGPGGRHLLLDQSGAVYKVGVREGPPVARHWPSVDVLFESVAQFAGRNAMGIILTGMGSDGTKGLLSMRQAGAYTVAQDEDSCVVFGMPKEAIEQGAVEDVLNLRQIASTCMRWHQRASGDLKQETEVQTWKS